MPEEQDKQQPSQPEQKNPVVSGIDPEHERKQPKRVIRTYQQDLARVSGGMQVEIPKQKAGEKNSAEKTLAPAQSSPEELPENLPGAGAQIKNMKLPPKGEDLTKLAEQQIAEDEAQQKGSKQEQVLRPVSVPKTPPAQPAQPEVRGTMHTIEELHVPSQPNAPVRPEGDITGTAPRVSETPEPIQVEEESEQPGGFMDWLREFFGIKKEAVSEEPHIVEEHETGRHVDEAPQSTPTRPAPKPEPVQIERAPLPPELQQPIPPSPKPPTLPRQKEESKQSAPLPRAPRPVVEVPKEVPQPTPTPPPAPKPEPVPLPKKELPKRDTDSALHTYTTDAQRKSGAKSRLELIAAEQDAGRGRSAPIQKSALPIILTSVVLFVLGAGLLIGAYIMLQEPAPVAQGPARVVTPAYSNDQVRISVSEVPSLEDLPSLTTQVPDSKGFTHVTIDTGSLTPIRTVFSTTDGVPGTLARTILPQSMFGLYGEEREPVFVLVVTSFDRALKGMLAWERELLETSEDLYGPIATVPVAVGTTTPETSDPITPTFKDRTLGTFDVRMVEDGNGLSHIMYGFVQEDVLLITQTPEAFRELAERILAE